MESLYTTWQQLGPIQGNIVAGAITVSLAIASYFLKPSVRLRWGRANISFHEMKAGEKPVHLNVEKHYLQNTGRKPATNVEFVYTFKPDEVAVWEPRDYSAKATPEGHYVVAIPQIAPGELLIIDSIYVNNRAAGVASVKCADCLGKEVEFRVLRHFGDKTNFALAALMAIGFYYLTSLIYNYLN
jgi:hypothetical protein